MLYLVSIIAIFQIAQLSSNERKEHIYFITSNVIVH